VLATASFEADTTGFAEQGSYGPGRPETYEILWDRVDYLLGLRPDWRPCPDSSTSVGLCGQFVDDRAPAQRIGP
jgi:hypothetical protein